LTIPTGQSLADSKAIVVDTVVPTVALTSASPTTTNAPFLVTATFSESVTGFIASDVNLTNSTISGFTGSGTTYNFTVTPNADGLSPLMSQQQQQLILLVIIIPPPLN
jgi:hypothetical protein